jgi:hypothetical protein
MIAGSHGIPLVVSPDVGLQVLARPLLERLDRLVAAGGHLLGVHVVDPVHPVRQALAEVPDDDAEVRDAVERPRGDQAKQMQPGFGAEPPDRTVEPRLLVRADRIRRQGLRVQVQRNVEIGELLEDLAELRFVDEIGAP